MARTFNARPAGFVARRRMLSAAIAGGLLTWRPPLGAQPPNRLIRIGWLSSVQVIGTPVYATFIEAMRERGWLEGRHFAIEGRFSAGQSERLPALAAELVQLNPDLIVSSATPTTAAALQATQKIPVIFFGVGDPVASGFVQSLARPGGNSTGFGGLGTGVLLKQLDLLLETAPKARRIAMFVNPELSIHIEGRGAVEAAARERGIVLRPVEIRSPADIDAAFETVARERIDTLLILGQPFYFQEAARMARLASLHRLAAVVPFEELAKAGVLMSYGVRLADDIKRLPLLIERIVHGTKPADIPVEQATRFYLTINVKTARAIGVAVPASVMLRADAIIE